MVIMNSLREERLTFKVAAAIQLVLGCISTGSLNMTLNVKLLPSQEKPVLFDPHTFPVAVWINCKRTSYSAGPWIEPGKEADSNRNVLVRKALSTNRNVCQWPFNFIFFLLSCDKITSSKKICFSLDVIRLASIAAYKSITD